VTGIDVEEVKINNREIGARAGTLRFRSAPLSTGTGFRTPKKWLQFPAPPLRPLQDVSLFEGLKTSEL